MLPIHSAATPGGTTSAPAQPSHSVPTVAMPRLARATSCTTRRSVTMQSVARVCVLPIRSVVTPSGIRSAPTQRSPTVRAAVIPMRCRATNLTPLPTARMPPVAISSVRLTHSAATTSGISHVRARPLQTAPVAETPRAAIAYKCIQLHIAPTRRAARRCATLIPTVAILSGTAFA